MMFSSKIVFFILGWLEEKFIVIYRADAAEIKSKLDNTEGGKVFINRTTMMLQNYLVLIQMH